VTSASTSVELAAALAGRKVAVLFHASWCGFCRAFRPRFRELLTEASGWAGVEVLLDDDASPLWGDYGVEVVPTVLFCDDGRVVARVDALRGVGITETMFREALVRGG
jgi:thioredoxin-like negative regulator of GroEL